MLRYGLEGPDDGRELHGDETHSCVAAILHVQLSSHENTLQSTVGLHPLTLQSTLHLTIAPEMKITDNSVKKTSHVTSVLINRTQKVRLRHT